MSSFRIAFPPQTVTRAAEEVVALEWPDGRTERVRLHDYARVYAVPGLYEEIVQRRLRCGTPARLAEMLAAAAGKLGWAPGDVRVLDVGAGNGVSGEEMAARGLHPAVAIDILPEARAAALRDRPGLYDLYLTADLLALDAEAAQAVRARRPNALVCSGAIGAGHLPARAFAAALDLLALDALVAYAVEPQLRDPDVDGVAALVARLGEAGRLHVIASDRYLHRLTVDGGERWAEAAIARLARG